MPGESGALARAAGRLDRLARMLSRACLDLAALACLAVFALVCYAVAMRYFMNRPLVWADEIAGWLIVAVVMLAVPDAQYRQENIGVDALTNRLSGRLKRVAAVFSALSVLVTAWIIMAEGFEMVAFSRMVGIVSNVLPDVPLWIVQSLVPIGAIVLLIVAAAQAMRLLAGQEASPDGGEPHPPRAVE